jgi:hypothetical protein
MPPIPKMPVDVPSITQLLVCYNASGECIYIWDKKKDVRFSPSEGIDKPTGTREDPGDWPKKSGRLAPPNDNDDPPICYWVGGKLYCV